MLKIKILILLSIIIFCEVTTATTTNYYQISTTGEQYDFVVVNISSASMTIGQRWYDSDNITELPHYFDVDFPQTVFVNVTSMGTNTTKKINRRDNTSYQDNSNLEATFTFADNFSTSVNVSGKWVVDGSIPQSGGKLTIPNTVDTGIISIAGLNPPLQSEIRMKVNFYGYYGFMMLKDSDVITEDWDDALSWYIMPTSVKVGYADTPNSYSYGSQGTGYNSYGMTWNSTSEGHTHINRLNPQRFTGLDIVPVGSKIHITSAVVNANANFTVDYIYSYRPNNISILYLPDTTGIENILLRAYSYVLG